MIFFNNVGYLGMCGHGTIGVAVTLAHLGRIGPGTHRLETPVGVVDVDAATARTRSPIENVAELPHRRRASTVDVPGLRPLRGRRRLGRQLVLPGPATTARRSSLANVERLTDFTWRIRQALNAQGITGADGGEIDHIELFGPPHVAGADSRNFVLCPGKAYDRSPCGTGTSAKLACLVADGKLAEGEVWRQESIIGSVFEGSARSATGAIIRRDPRHGLRQRRSDADHRSRRPVRHGDPAMSTSNGSPGRS